MKMLIADDNRAIVDVLKRYAEDEGFQVMTAEDGETALALCQEQTFSMILLDVMMPGLDGFTVCRRIREQSMVPIIMITARGKTTSGSWGWKSAPMIIWSNRLCPRK